MGFHHVALATRDLAATHRFYTEAMGFVLVKAVVAPTDQAQPDEQGGWAKHVFYDTGGEGLIAFWELHDETIGEFDPAISTALGLPAWVNHIAFDAQVTDLPARVDRWLDLGFDVAEIDHGFCRSVYAVDPNGILVEWCADIRPLDEADRIAAEAALRDPSPPLEGAPEPVFHLAEDARVGRIGGR
jgi:catechol 2,3-dioxygenase-like lactoylglutathione lyase family enzyme